MPSAEATDITAAAGDDTGSPAPSNAYDVLLERDLVAQCTETEEAIRRRLSSPTTLYCGFDPTADSLHVGSLVPILALGHLQRYGHKPLVVVGGATAMVGDPSGKSSARQMLTRAEINHNAGSVGDQIGRIVRMGAPRNGAGNEGVLLNNADWLDDVTWIDLLREVGQHFSVNRMLTMDSVKSRMSGEGDGISFLEFNYMVMQAYDFAHLNRSHGCTLQIGGQDQWGNIVMGIDLARRQNDASLAGLTLPLVTKADGSKFGKSEAGNIWLDAERTSVFDFFQFWRNTADADLSTFLARFTMLPMDQVRELTADRTGPALNEAKVVLAREVTALVHGEAAADEAADAAKRAFSGNDVTAESVPNLTLGQAEVADGVGLLTVMVRGGLVGSNGEARRLIKGGGVKLNDERVDDPSLSLTAEHFEPGHAVIRVGKKRLLRLDLA